MGSPRGYSVVPGMYRVPDLLTEEQFCAYMLNQYGRTVEFTDGLNLSPARALGQSRPVGLVNEADSEEVAYVTVPDPILRSLNEMDFRTDKEKAASEKAVEDSEEELEEESEGLEDDAPYLPVDHVDSDGYKDR